MGTNKVFTFSWMDNIFGMDLIEMKEFRIAKADNLFTIQKKQTNFQEIGKWWYIETIIDWTDCKTLIYDNLKEALNNLKTIRDKQNIIFASIN